MSLLIGIRESKRERERERRKVTNERTCGLQRSKESKLRQSAAIQWYKRMSFKHKGASEEKRREKERERESKRQREEVQLTGKLLASLKKVQQAARKQLNG